jgi:hypothetical protein
MYMKDIQYGCRNLISGFASTEEITLEDINSRAYSKESP